MVFFRLFGVQRYFNWRNFSHLLGFSARLLISWKIWEGNFVNVEEELTLEEEESQAVEAVVAIVDSRPPQGPDLKLLAPWIISQLAQDSSFSIPDVEDLP